MNNAFLVRFSASTWTARKLDKNATREAKAAAGATEKAGVKVYKSVIAADALDKVAAIANAARTEHRKRTVPWAYDGPGAITAEGYPAYKESMGAYRAQFYDAVGAFLTVYAEERIKARAYLGTMFNDADYPTLESLTDKFAFSVTAEPVPTADAFQVVGLTAEDVESIKKGIVNSGSTALTNANNVAWDRVKEAVGKLKTRLDEYTSGTVTKFFDSWVDNIKEVADMIPSINVANDKKLTVIADDLRALTIHTPERLKDNVNLRSAVAKAASAILEEIQEWKSAA